MTEHSVKLFINNELVPSTSGRSLTLHCHHPVNADDSTAPAVVDIPVAGREDVDAAVDAAVAAFRHGPWTTAFSAAQRAACMLKLADLIEENAAQLARLEGAAIGQPQAVGEVLVASCASAFRYYAGWADKISGETYPADDGVYKLVRYEPLGVCAGIGSWNSSHMTFAWKAAPALAAGNTSDQREPCDGDADIDGQVVYKSSEKSPLGLAALGPFIKRAGFPPGVIQILCGDGSTGELLAAHMKVAKVSFTGSRAVGRMVQDAANRSNMKRCTLELGGKSPAIVFEDAPFDDAVNGGQVCAATSRIYVQSGIADKFISALKASFQAVAPTIGPLADRTQFERVVKLIEAGKKEAELVTGGVGDSIAESGKELFVEPTLFANPQPGAAILRQEIFGPVATINVFDTEEEAVKLANDTEFGLSAAIYTESMARAIRVSSALEAGTVGVNAPFFPSVQTAFGGYKQSGQGRELGLSGILAYLQVKSIHIKYDGLPKLNESKL